MSRAEFLATLRQGAAGEVNWSAELEELHDDATRDHWIDLLTRRSLVEAIESALRPDVVVVDLGCGSGHLLADVRSRCPGAFLVGVDAVPEGLAKAGRRLPGAEMILADVTALPFGDSTVDVVVSANLLEHVADDGRALAELARVLRRGGRAALVVPAGPGLVDYYDRALGHERRYARGELAVKARAAGLRVVADHGLGSLAFPAFWLVKKAHRLRGGSEAETRVARDIERTRRSRAGVLAGSLESRARLRLPFGIRYLTVLVKP